MPPLKAFISYAKEDESSRVELETHLKTLEREGILETWTFRDISAGEEWRLAIDTKLEEADVILLLVSANFIASDYCYNVEMKRAVARHRDHSATLIPIIIRDCDWSSTPFAAIQALPPSARPVSNWKPKDRAWSAVAKEIRRVAATISTAVGGAAATVVAETAMQRARRFAAEADAREAHQKMLATHGRGAFREEADRLFAMLESAASEIASTTSAKIVAGAGEGKCVVRQHYRHGHHYPITLICYPYAAPESVQESHINARLWFGGIPTPEERQRHIEFHDRPVEHETIHYKFRLSPDGVWCWLDPTTGDLLPTDRLADSLLVRLMELHSAVDRGEIQQPVI